MSVDVTSLTTAVSGGELMRHVHEFARRVKLSGTPEERESFGCLKAQLDAIGYRTRLLMHDAYTSLPGKAQVETVNETLRATTHSFSRPSPPDGLRAALLDMGEGSEADFAGQDASGRIVLVEGIASPAVAARASAAGALGQIHVSPQEQLHEMCISPVWGSPSVTTLATLPSTAVCTVSQSDGTQLRRRLMAGEALDIALRAEVDTGWRKTPLLEAELDGQRGAAALFVLFSGHHDTWYQGVMDNGAANATMLEAARVLAEHADAWQRGLRI
ncbi:peptidase family M28 [Roseomonas sp. TAS13]|uniref:M28 family peptidase n=1 Tax=Roseomonas sp. TAS13 TaxID=1926319 RepID=UPI00096056D6|nr:M28 family peptidase [Roseomonas sp. TAS13]USQ74346.1 M28 family metallopeptidase [Roseomonas mucosa]GAV36565.1 peptidase family M28 [Roseomonas sp. TAS13]